MRKTKIVCTLGPATDVEGVLEKLVKNGMDVARFNFSHGSYEEQKERMDLLKKLRKTYQHPIAVLLDTKGPEIRLKSFADGKVELHKGQNFTLRCDDAPGDETGVGITRRNWFRAAAWQLQ